ncbi:MAG: hypothetical protein AAFU64_04410 [Bacteroidota bacterium]
MNRNFLYTFQVFLTLSLLLLGSSLFAQSPVLTGFTLINPQNDSEIQALNDGDEIFLNSLSSSPLNIRADFSGNDVSSVQFTLRGPGISFTRTENIVPYALFGDNSGNFLGAEFTPGTYRLSATAFSESRAQGVASPTLEISFTISLGELPVISEFALIDPQTNEELQTLEEGALINPTDFPNGFGIVAKTNPSRIGSVEFLLNQERVIENIFPYSFAGDVNGDVNPVELEPGNYTLIASPFSQTRLNGEAGEPVSINFEIAGAGEAIVRLSQVNTISEEVSIKNFGDAAQDVANFQFCLGPGQYNILSNYSNVSGDLILEPNEEITFDLTSGTLNVQALPDAAGALALFANNNFGSNSADDIQDFIQWGAANQNRVGQAVNAGRWTSANEFVAGAAPYNFVGQADQIGPNFWIDATLIRMIQINPESDEVVIKNFDNVDRDLSNYFFCTLAGVYPQLGNINQVEILEGDLNLAPDEEVRVKVLTTGGVVDNEGSIFLFSSNILGFNNQNPAVTRDFAQWDAPNGFRVENAVATGRWDDVANFIAGNDPFSFIGGANDFGANFWEATQVGEAIIRLLQVDTDAESVTIKNFGTAAQDVSDYQFCLGPGQYNILSNYSNVSGDLNLEPNEEITFDLSSGSLNVQALP